jgi:hypothetical protein
MGININTRNIGNWIMGWTNLIFILLKTKQQ